MRTIVVNLDQAIVTGKLMPTSSFTLGEIGATGSSSPFTKAVYNARTHTVSLSLARTPKLSGLFQLRVGADAIVNALGQHLDGNGDGYGGDDFVRTIRLK